MRKTSVILAAMLCMFANVAYAAKVKLTLDFAVKPQWTYEISHTAECVTEDAKGVSSKKTAMKGTLSGTVSKEKDKMDVAVKDLTVTSDLYDEEATKELAERIQATAYSLGLVDGYPVVDTSVDFAAEGLPEWNLYLQLARLVPEVSDKPAKKGMEWERTVTLPVPTAQGKIECEVYRLFRVESISKKKDKATISWEFRYSATADAEPSASQLKYAPVSGKGGGKAELDVVNKCIVHAQMTFETAVAQLDDAKVTWKEKAALDLKQAK